ncbi:MAG: GIY-YIG nuclease family protein [Xenococcaceae cyanobacterium MO_188.B19]|nr:GIY-YIG nuclease family protein [Xenococcaceae cyanobacterium MO_188.B19]
MTNKGGRGKKALYKTTHSRIPENIKIVVDSISDLYKQYVQESGCLDFDHKSLLPSVSAIYIVFNESEILYVGQTKNLTSRWKSHHLLKSIREINDKQSVSIAWINYEQENLLTSLEKLLIEGLEPRLNETPGNRLGNEASLVKYESKWKSGKTKTIRVPVAIAEQVLEIAHQLDEGILPDISQYINNNGTASKPDNEIKKLKQKISELEKQLISVTSDKNGVLSKDERAEPETHLNKSNITDTSELIEIEEARTIISEGLSTPSNRGGGIRKCLIQLGISLGFKIERVNRKWSITDTSDIYHNEEVKSIISDGLLIPSGKGAEIKKCLAQLGNLLGFKVEKNSKKQWIITDTSD